MPRPVHFEIHASDPDKVREFYSQLFGWTFQQWQDNPYWLVTTEEPHEHSDDVPHEHEPGINGGLLPRDNNPIGSAERVNAWVITTAVPDCDASVATALEAGGSVAMPAQDLPDIGRLAYLKDPDGNLFGVLQPLG